MWNGNYLCGLMPRRIGFTRVILLLMLSAHLGTAAEPRGAPLVQQLMRETGVDRGVCCTLGVDTKTILPLIKSGHFFVHVLVQDRDMVTELRKVANQSGFGIDRLLIECIDTRQLPHADNMIDLLLAPLTTANQLDQLAISEVLRVLRPEGMAIIGDLTRASNVNIDASLKQWSASDSKAILKAAKGNLLVLRKPSREGTGNWPLWQHSPDNNPVSVDQVIQAPYLTQFMAGPLYITMPAITTIAGGRTFLATGNIAHHRREWPWINQLIARNGYNGTILWQRPLPNGFLAHRSAYIATTETFYLIDGNGCLKLDAQTGEEQGRITIPGIDGDWKWMTLDNGIMFVMSGPHDGLAEIIKGDRSFGGWSWADLSSGYYRRPHVPWGFGHMIAAYDLAGKKELWKHEEHALIDSRALAMRDGKLLLYCPDTHFRCLDTKTGQVFWTNNQADVRQLVEQPGRGLVSTPGFRSECMALATPEVFIIQGQTRMNVVALSSKDGSLLWTKKKFTNNPNAIYIDGHIVLGVGPRGSHVALDPLTGDVVEDYHFHKVSCTRLTGCPDSLFVRGEGTLRFDRRTKKVLIDGGVRPACNDGAMPANGLLYLGPWQCDCNLSWIGSIARCSSGDFRFDWKASDEERLELGKSGSQSVAPFQTNEHDWPTYRANNQRSASTPTELAAPGATDRPQRIPQWTYTPPSPTVPTPPIAAGTLVFSSGSDGYLRAIDTQSGQLTWQYATGGPIKASPTVWEGRVFVGAGDGYVYCLEAATGRLLWRFRAAPIQRRIMVYGNLCSTWPVNTGVLIHGGVAYFAAGIIDQDGTYVYAIDAQTGSLKWQNNSCGHLNPELRKGVSAAGNLSIMGDRLLLAGGNQVNPATFELTTGRCLSSTFAQGQPKANHGKFVGVFNQRYPIAGGRVLYASPRNVANKDSFVLIRNGRSIPLDFGGIPPAWNDTFMTMVNFRNGKLRCYDTEKVLRRLGQGFPPPGTGDRRPQNRWRTLVQILDADDASIWQTDLDNPNRFETLAMAITPSRVAAVIQFQNRVRARPQWQVAALKADDGTPIWFWRHELLSEPLPDGLAVGRQGQIIVALLDGSVLSLAPKRPAR